MIYGEDSFYEALNQCLMHTVNQGSAKCFCLVRRRPLSCETEYIAPLLTTVPQIKKLKKSLCLCCRTIQSRPTSVCPINPYLYSLTMGAWGVWIIPRRCEEWSNGRAKLAVMAIRSLAARLGSEVRRWMPALTCNPPEYFMVAVICHVVDPDRTYCYPSGRLPPILRPHPY